LLLLPNNHGIETHAPNVPEVVGVVPLLLVLALKQKDERGKVS